MCSHYYFWQYLSEAKEDYRMPSKHYNDLSMRLDVRMEYYSQMEKIQSLAFAGRLSMWLED